MRRWDSPGSAASASRCAGSPSRPSTWQSGSPPDPSAVAHDLIFGAVGIEEVEAPAGFVIGMVERRQSGFHDLALGGLDVLDDDADVVERPSLREQVVG